MIATKEIIAQETATNDSVSGSISLAPPTAEEIFVSTLAFLESTLALLESQRQAIKLRALLDEAEVARRNAVIHGYERHAIELTALTQANLISTPMIQAWWERMQPRDKPAAVMSAPMKPEWRVRIQPRSKRALVLEKDKPPKITVRTLIVIVAGIIQFTLIVREFSREITNLAGLLGIHP